MLSLPVITAVPASVPCLFGLRFQRSWQGRHKVFPCLPMGQAISYTLGNWEAFNRYLEDGDLAIDNNRAERALRGPVVGRGNWTFFGSDEGGKRAAILLSLVSTCKDHKIDPFLYLRDLFQRIAFHPMNRLDELLPDRWLEQTKRLSEAA